ncbi:hypothetical protein OEZ85_004846 [Tetradesmus obliquus]|uniref:RecA family profile 1 domain-containing protein n=1 Tax=Tetradesmus obliquus TaxID=3088 RepID=A0ABY8ULG7_TETOB|nr:hypothetical protein OEZ85_004846 [Tetradesmus obliquus]
MDPYSSSSSLLLRDTSLDPGSLQLLVQHNLHSCQELLLLSAVDLMERLDVPYSRADWLLAHAAMHLAPSYTTALELHTTSRQHSVRVLTGLQGLDAALRGGLPAGVITELVGPAGVGKSQTCYTIALQVALPRALGGLEAMLMYIDTEGKFSTQRLLEMASARVTAAVESGLLPALSGCHTAVYESLIEPVLTRMLILKPDSVEQLQAQLEALKREVRSAAGGMAYFCEACDAAC